MKAGVRQFYAAVGGFVTGNVLAGPIAGASTGAGLALGIGLGLLALAYVHD